MKQTTHLNFFPSAVSVVMVAILSTFLLATAQPSFAATDKKKTPVTRASAVDYTEDRIKQLQTALKISDAQELLWNNLTLVMRENAKDIDALRKTRAESSKNLNAVDDLKFHSQMTEANLAQQKKFIPPFEALYTSMSDEQKKITDTLFKTGKHGKRTMK